MAQLLGSDAPPIGQRYDVGGRRLWLDRSGSGGPAVVFLAGASAVGLDYLNVHHQTAELTTSVLYDRGGTGWSDPADLPRSAARGRDRAAGTCCAPAGVPGPYLLVPHYHRGRLRSALRAALPRRSRRPGLPGCLLRADRRLPARAPAPGPGAPTPAGTGPAPALMRPLARRMYRGMFAGSPSRSARSSSSGTCPRGGESACASGATWPELAGAGRRGGPLPERAVDRAGRAGHRPRPAPAPVWPGHCAR